MLYVLNPFNALLMIALPIALAMVLAKKTRAPWSLFWIGAVAFVGSQVIHLPLNSGLTAFFKWLWPDATPQPWHIPFNAVVLGLTAGLCEETARYVSYRFFAPRARAFRDGLMLGAGHGGIEAILLGLLAGYTFIQMASLQQTGLDGLGLSGAQLDLARQQVNAYWSAPAYMAVLGAVERLFSLTVHVALSVLVLQTFVRRQWRWLVYAIGFHALSDAVAVLLVQLKWSALAIEGVIGLFAVAGLLIIWILRPRDGLIPEEPEPALVPGASVSPQSAQREKKKIREQIDDSRYA